MREALKMEKVRGKMPEGVERQERGAGNGTRTNVKNCNKAADRQRMQTGMGVESWSNNYP